MAPPVKKIAKKSEEKNLIASLLRWGVVIIGVCGIIWMIEVNPPLKKLNCRATPTTSLTGFGSCTTDEP